MKKILYIYGPQGSGKTLAASLIKGLINKEHDTVLWNDHHLSVTVLRSVRPKLLIIDDYIFDQWDVALLDEEVRRGQIQIILISNHKPVEALHPIIIKMETSI